MDQKLNAAQQETLKANGFFFEGFMDFWCKDSNGRCATISNGISINGDMLEVQVTTSDGEYVDGKCKSETVAEAIAAADEILNRK